MSNNAESAAPRTPLSILWPTGTETATSAITIPMEREFTERRGENRDCVLSIKRLYTRSQRSSYETLPFADAARRLRVGGRRPFACPFEESSAAFFSLSTTRLFRQ